MLPKTHIIFGAIFSVLVYFLTGISIFYAFLIFLPSVFIDVDHYIWFVLNKKNTSLKEAYYWHKNKISSKPALHIFHTIEFHTIILCLSLIWIGFLYVFIGLVFHSIFDLIDMINAGEYHSREFSHVRYLFRDRKNYL